MDDLFSAKNPQDSSYCRLRDDKRLDDRKSFCESLWVNFHELADSNFIKELGDNFNTRFWEMYLGAAFRKIGFNPTSADSGPDLEIDSDTKTIWVEAHAAKAGTTDDRAYGVTNGTRGVPVDKILLRLRNSISKKYLEDYRKYISDETIGPDDPYVIAINGYDIPSSGGDSFPTYIMQAVFGIGNGYGIINKETGKIIEQGYRPRTEIPKTRGAPVTATVFEDENYSGISAILYSRASVGNGPDDLGTDFQLVYNPLAKNPLPKNWIKIGLEIWATEKNIEHLQW